MRRAVLLAVALSTAPAPASALSLVLQSRDVEARAGYAPLFQPSVIFDSETASATDFSPFAVAVDAELTGFSRISSDSRATQDSSITVGPGGSLETLVSGNVEAGATAYSGAGEDVFASSSSDYLLSFELTRTQSYEMVVAATASTSSFHANALVLIELTRDGSEVIERMRMLGGVLDTETFGLLSAGTYSLRVEGFVGAGAFEGEFSNGGDGRVGFDVMLRVLPEPGPAALLLLAAAALGIRRATALSLTKAPRRARSSPL